MYVHIHRFECACVATLSASMPPMLQVWLCQEAAAAADRWLLFSRMFTPCRFRVPLGFLLCLMCIAVCVYYHYNITLRLRQRINISSRLVLFLSMRRSRRSLFKWLIVWDCNICVLLRCVCFDMLKRLWCSTAAMMWCCIAAPHTHTHHTKSSVIYPDTRVSDYRASHDATHLDTQTHQTTRISCATMIMATMMMLVWWWSIR